LFCLLINDAANVEHMLRRLPGSTKTGLKVRGLGGSAPQLRGEWGGKLREGIRKGVSGER